jgi:hypothetical protein
MSSRGRFGRWLGKQPAYHPAWTGARRRWLVAESTRRLARWVRRAS